MTSHAVSNTTRRVLLRVVVKLMLSILLLGLIVMMSRAFLTGNKEAAVEPLRIRVGQLEAGASQGVEWRKRRWLVVRPSEAKNYIIVLDYDPLYGCPLLWTKPGDASAPQQPWHGGLRAICTDHWYDPQGHSLSPDIADLKLQPYQFEGNDTLVVSVPQR
jgi:hypothetical protein